MPRREKKWKRNEGEEKEEAVQLESLMAWVTQRIGVAGHVPHLIDDSLRYISSSEASSLLSSEFQPNKGCQMSGPLSANCLQSIGRFAHRYCILS